MSKAELKADWGIVNDAHAGNWHRQVSLLAGESIDKVKELIPDLEKGAFAENIITRGINLMEITIGEKISIADEIILEITQIGKECHSGCAIQKINGDCIMPKEGIFAKVIKGGVIETNSKVVVNS
ncbi:MAG: MOSC domain-containing protein [Melioribacteraceae bacterium]|nr:MOSC domain-containing protein [Melioribacteraceae bacterium]